VSQAKFVEGNSSPSRYSSRDKTVTRPALQWGRIVAEVEAGPTTVHSPYRLADRRAMRHSGFFCM
jgi:hypothetical protein